MFFLFFFFILSWGFCYLNFNMFGKQTSKLKCLATQGIVGVEKSLARTVRTSTITHVRWRMTQNSQGCLGHCSWRSGSAWRGRELVALEVSVARMMPRREGVWTWNQLTWFHFMVSMANLSSCFHPFIFSFFLFRQCRRVSLKQEKLSNLCHRGLVFQLFC